MFWVGRLLTLLKNIVQIIIYLKIIWTAAKGAFLFLKLKYEEKRNAKKIIDDSPDSSPPGGDVLD